MDTPESRTMTVNDVSAYLHVHTTTEYCALKHGQLPAFKLGGNWGVNAETIDRWRLKQERLRSKFGRGHFKLGRSYLEQVENFTGRNLTAKYAIRRLACMAAAFVYRTKLKTYRKIMR